MRFCIRENCNNNLTSIVKNNTVVFRCNVCFEEYSLTNEDTLMIDEHFQENNTIHKHKTYLQNACHDDIAELVYKNCPNRGCTETIVKIIKLAESGQALYVCPTCRTQFA